MGQCPDRDENPHCGGCGREVVWTRGPCPYCGSTTQAHTRTASLTIGIRLSEASARLRHPGKKNFLVEIVQGLFPSKDQGLHKGVELTRTIDRANDAYTETVVDAETGQKLRECREPLSQHRHESRSSE